jgi:hypothetical protein
MTIKEAFEDFITSDAFKEIAKRKDIPEGSKFRQYKQRFQNGELGNGPIVDILQDNGYLINVTKSKKITVKPPKDK